MLIRAGVKQAGVIVKTAASSSFVAFQLRSIAFVAACQSGAPATPRLQLSRAQIKTSHIKTSFSTSRTMTEWTPEAAIPQDLKDYIASSPSASHAHSNMFVFLHILQRLKTTKRTGWVDFNVANPESIGDHMYRMSIISMLTGDESLNVSRCVKIALVHDMAEALVGDITPVDNVTKEEKHRREYDTMVYFKSLLHSFNARAAEEIFTLWNEYENISSPEARFVKDVDKFELLVQTLEYERQHNGTKNLVEFTRVRDAIKTKEVASWADGLLEERALFWRDKQVPETKRGPE